jgi:TetR/AcrR family transcriptional regulator, repressor for uid operon
MRIADPHLQARRRQEVLDAAIQCFTKNGFHQTSMKNIAEASGLSMGLLYRYFANKEAIIVSAAQKDRDASLQAIHGIKADGDAVRAWATLLAHLVAVAAEPEYVRLVNEVIAEAGRVPAILEGLRADDAAIALAVASKLSEQVASGALPKLHVTGAAQGLLVLYDGLVYRRMIAPASEALLNAKRIAGLVRGVLASFESVAR